MTTPIATAIIPPVGAPCALIGEIGNAHNGVYANAVRLLDDLKAAGATAAKLQCYTADELVALRGDGPAPDPWGAQGWTMRSLYAHAATPLDWFPGLYAHAAAIGLPLFSSVFGLTSLAVLEAVGNPVYKVSAFEAWQPRLLRYVVATDKPVLVSLRTLAYEPLGALKVPSKAANVAYLTCSGGYPTPVADVHLPAAFPAPLVGVSSHCLAPELPIAAVARGARVLEFHVQLDDTPSALEAHVSLPISTFRRMVASVRTTEALLA